MAPQIFASDFNALFGAHEKRGNKLPKSISCNNFLAQTNANLLLHLSTTGVHFTWYNGRLNSDCVALRLDLASCNEAWTNFWASTSCNTLVGIESDHNPLLLHMEVSLILKRTSFNFETSSHPFLFCDFAVHLWHWLGSKMNCAIQLLSVLDIFQIIPVHCSSQLRDFSWLPLSTQFIPFGWPDCFAVWTC